MRLKRIMVYLEIILLIVLILGFGFLYFISISPFKRKAIKLDKKIVQDRWREIEVMISQGGPSNFYSAVIEADKLFDYVLKGMVGDNNQNMGERLKFVQKKFSDWEIYQGVWEAHKIRNRLVHDIEHELHSSVARKAVKQFEKGFRDLGVI